jgi:hypothetical protein
MNANIGASGQRLRETVLDAANRVQRHRPRHFELVKGSEEV